jgi:hypothetical protein
MANSVYCVNGHYVSLIDRIPRARSAGHLRAMMERASQYEGQGRVAAFCTKCGAVNISACQHCQTPMEHKYVGDRHSYCGACGKPFPWTETALMIAREYTDELDELSTEDKTTLKATFVDLTVDSPKTEIAASRFKRILRKLAPDVGETIRKTIVEIASETASKLIKG